MKKVLSRLLVIVLMFAFNTGASADEAICVTLDGNYVGFDVEPQVIDGRIMVPIRAILRLRERVLGGIKQKVPLCVPKVTPVEK